MTPLTGLSALAVRPCPEHYSLKETAHFQLLSERFSIRESGQIRSRMSAWAKYDLKPPD